MQSQRPAATWRVGAAPSAQGSARRPEGSGHSPPRMRSRLDLPAHMAGWARNDQPQQRHSVVQSKSQVCKTRLTMWEGGKELLAQCIGTCAKVHQGVLMIEVASFTIFSIR